MEEVVKQGQEKVDNIVVEKSGVDYLTFRIGKQKYGCPVAKVREVLEYELVFEVPKVPDHITGVMNLRGELLPVIDLSYRLYEYKTTLQRTSAIIITEIEFGEKIHTIGLLIDEVDAVLHIKDSDISDLPEFGAKIRVDFIEKVAGFHDDFFIILNLDRVVDLNEISRFK